MHRIRGQDARTQALPIRLHLPHRGSLGPQLGGHAPTHRGVRAQVIGPMRQPKINATNGYFLGIVSKASQAKNDSMSFVDGKHAPDRAGRT